jgi:PBP1b-binding outer membrane lipoprotein LpoB
MNRKIFVSLLVIMLLTVGCASAATPAPQASRGLAPGAPPPAQPQAPEASGQTDAGNQPEAANVAGAERMIVYSGQLSLVVKDARGAVDQITQIVQSAGGFVTASSTYEDAGYTRATMTVRIPGEDLAQLKATLSKVKELALQVEKEDLNGQDVTDQYADNQAEIDNLTAQRDSYRKLLDRATKMEDILSIQARLDDVQGRINRLTGQQLKLKENVKLATVDITLTPDALAQPVRIGNWRPEGTARDALQALFWALQTIGKILIWTVICVLPIGLLLGVPTFLVVRYARSRRRKATPVPPQT